MNRRKFLISSTQGSAALLSSFNLTAQQPRSEIIVGQSVDLSGPLQNLGRDYFTGAKLAFDQVNASGGTAGRKWRFIQIDDGAVPAQAVSNVSRLLTQDRADILFGFTSDACVEAVLAAPAFKASGRLLFAPMSGLASSGAGDRVVYVRATYAEELLAMFRQFSAGNMSTVTIAHTPAPASLATRNAAMDLLRKHNIPLPSLVTLKDDGSNAAALASGIGRTPPQALVIIADTIPAALLARELRGRAPGMMIGMTSAVDATALQQILGAELSFGLLLSRVVPNPHKGTERVVREFSRVLTKYLDEAPTAASLEGYIAGRALIETVRRSGNATGTPALLQGMRSLDLGGWELAFGNDERTSHRVDISMITRSGALLG
ncbi:ABC transporter substrate-binding protein [Uliginosibacterium sp. H3]|uniref:ABC transporter substrate-binding protein n=1 Tax=Uliginosibacterium silvisoli TaxID=3114758 RepID=A0ABU6K9G8_9RHOO|nr:ABC transporter substrate-binding protein [Uliginosibacterium sp. H3]